MTAVTARVIFKTIISPFVVRTIREKNLGPKRAKGWGEERGARVTKAGAQQTFLTLLLTIEASTFASEGVANAANDEFVGTSFMRCAH